MKLVVSLVFFLAGLQDRSAAGAPTIVYTGVEGENVTVLCPLMASGVGMFFCREQCQEGDTLIQSGSQRAQSARHSIRYDGGRVLQVNITRLKKSDSGLYRCGFGTAASSTLFRQIEIIVVDALLDGNRDPPAEETLHATAGSNITVRCSFTFRGTQRFFCKDPCREEDVLVNTSGDAGKRGRYSIKYLGFPTFGHLYVSIAGLTAADSGRYQCRLDTSSLGFEIRVTGDTVMLSVAVPLVVTGFLAPVAALVFCRRSCSTAAGERSRAAARGPNKQAGLYENVPLGSTYLSLHPATRDLDQTYCTLTPTQHA